MEDREILDCIHSLVADERRLRDLRDRGEISPGADQAQLTGIRETLDQMWDLLRHRRALRNAGLDPDQAGPTDTLPRSVSPPPAVVLPPEASDQVVDVLQANAQA